jgi:hypothetical protein
MPPQWNPYDEIPSPRPGNNPLIADRSPLDDILGNTIPSPPQAQQVQPGIPTALISMVPDVPAPPAIGRPQPLPPMTGEIPVPPARVSKPEPLRSLYDIPSPGPLPADLAPNFTAVDYARALDVVEAPSSVDVAGSTQRAQTAEKNLETFTRALGDTQAEAVAIGEQLVPLENQARQLDARIEALKGKKKRMPDEERALSAAQVARKSLTPQINALSQQSQEATQRFQTAQQQQATAKLSAEQSRQQATTDVATMELEAERRGAAAQVAGAALFAQESKRIEDDAKAQASKIQAQETAARSRMDEDRKAYREALKTGPAKTSMVLTVASVIAEAMAARQSGRPPDFGRVIGQLEQSTKAQFDERVQRQLALIAEGEDSLSKAAQERRVIDGQKAARLSETLRTIEMEIETKKLKARGTVEEARLAMVQGDVRKMIEQSDAAALAAYRKTLAADEQAELDRKLKEAQLRKTNAEAAEKEGEAARKAGGGGRAVGPGTLDPYSVFLPDGGDTPVAAFARNADGAKRASAANEAIIANDDTLRGLNEIEAMIEDYGSANAGDFTEFTKSKEFRRLETAIQFMEPALAKVSSGGFSSTQTDTQWAQNVLAAPKAWTGGKEAALTKLREAKRQVEERYRNGLKKAGIADAARERIVAARREQSISQDDVAKAEFAAAPKILADAKADPKRKLAAIANVIEQQKQAAPGGAWALSSIQILKNAQAATEDPDVETRLAEEIAKLRKIHLGKGEDVPRGPQTEAELPSEDDYLRQQYGGIPALNPGAK